MRRIESENELVEWAASPDEVAGKLVADIKLIKKVTIPEGKYLEVKAGVTIDLDNQRDILVIDGQVAIPPVPVFKNAVPLVDGRLADAEYPSITGEWGGTPRQAVWWRLPSEGESVAETDLRALQCAVDSGRFLSSHWPCQYQHEVKFSGFRWSIGDTPLDVAGRRVTLTGDGRDSSHIEYSGEVGIVFTRHEFNEGGRYQSRLRDFSIRPVGDDSLAAIAAFGTCDEQTLIERVSIFSIGKHGILIDGGQNGLVIRECTISGRVIGGHEDASGVSFTHTQPGGQWSIGCFEKSTVNVGGSYSAIYVGPETGPCELAFRDIHTEHAAIRIESDNGFVKVDNCNAGNVADYEPVIEINSGSADASGAKVMVRGYTGNGSTFRAKLIDHQTGVNQQVYTRTIMKYDRAPNADGGISYDLQRDGL